MLAPEDRGRNGAAAPTADPEERADPLLALLVEVSGHVARLVRIGSIRAQVRARRVACVLLAGTVLGLVAVSLGLAGARLIARGLTAGLSEWLDGRLWLAELSSGLALVGITILSILAARSWGERRLLHRLGTRHADDDTHT